MYLLTVKVGKNYSAEYVNRLYRSAGRHLSLEFTPICITENADGLDPGIETIKPPLELPGYWNKMFLFSDILPPGEVLYLDIDQLITGDITPFVEACRETQKPLSGSKDAIAWLGVKLNSSWLHFHSPDLKPIYDDFVAELPASLETPGGDQAYIWNKTKDIFFVEDIFPQAIRSFKFQLCKKIPSTTNDSYSENVDYAVHNNNVYLYPMTLDPDIKIVNFHGYPKPHHLIHLNWVEEHWR